MLGSHENAEVPVTFPLSYKLRVREKMQKVVKRRNPILDLYRFHLFLREGG